jgi:hypothetical protein
MSYLIWINYMTHKSNLIMQILSIMPMVSKLEDLFQLLYGFFNSQKHQLQFTNILGKIVDLNFFEI